MVPDFNFLGLINSSDLKWHKHIEHISLKISKVIGIIYRIKSILQTDILLTCTMYNALIMPHFNYCLLACASNIKAGHKLHKKRPKELLMAAITLHILNKSVKKIQVVKLTGMF